MASPSDPLKNLKILEKKNLSVGLFFEKNRDRIQLTAATIIRDTYGIADIRGRKPHPGHKLKKAGKP